VAFKGEMTRGMHEMTAGRRKEDDPIGVKYW